MHAFVIISALVATVAASHLPLETPEVAAARAQHLAAVEQAKIRAWSAPAVTYYAPTWSTWSAPVVVNGHVQDTEQVAVEKARHLSILAAEYARHGSAFPVASVGAAPEAAQVVVVNGHVQETPQVAQARSQHLAAHAEARARVGSYAAEAPVIAYAQPAVVAATPYVAHAAVAVPGLQSQYHSQDGLGQYSYGYAGGPSSKAESKSIDGVTRGSFSYIDSNGLIQSRSYVADDNGFRVAASDLPVGPAESAPVAVAAPVAPVAPIAVAPVVASHTPVVVDAEGHLADTVEVAEAKAAHFAAHNEARARLANAY